MAISKKILFINPPLFIYLFFISVTWTMAFGVQKPVLILYFESIYNKETPQSVSSATQKCLTLCDPMDCSMPGFPIHHWFPELAQNHGHRAGDAMWCERHPWCLIFFNFLFYNEETYWGNLGAELDGVWKMTVNGNIVNTTEISKYHDYYF